jgi:hypothetical protein
LIGACTHHTLVKLQPVPIPTRLEIDGAARPPVNPDLEGRSRCAPLGRPALDDQSPVAGTFHLEFQGCPPFRDPNPARPTLRPTVAHEVRPGFDDDRLLDSWAKINHRLQGLEMDWPLLEQIGQRLGLVPQVVIKVHSRNR